MPGMKTALIEGLKRWSGAAFDRGRSLLSGDRLFDLRVEASTLRGAARGVRQAWYAIELELDEAGEAPKRARCTCPAGADGRCKHVPALGLAWATTPGRFTVLTGIEARLHRRSYEELVSMVALMVRTHPELEALTLAPVPGGHREAPSVTRWRTVADDVFRRHGDDWTAVAGLIRELESVRSLGDDFNRQGQRAHAAAVYEGLMDSVVANASRFPWPDVRSRFRAMIEQCVQQLPGRPAARQALATLESLPLLTPRRSPKSIAAA
jgi:uncharacterized Zn finger protein